VRRFSRKQSVHSVAEITPERIAMYLRVLDLAPATIRLHRYALSRFCRFLQARDLLEDNPAP